MFRLGLAQCRHPSDGDVCRMADGWMARAAEAGVDFLVFPESLMTPYEQDVASFAAAAEPLEGSFATAMGKLAARHGLWVAFTMNERPADLAGVSPAEKSSQAMEGPHVAKPPRAAGPPRGGTSHAPGSSGMARVSGESGLAASSGARLPFNTAVMVDDTGVQRSVYRKVHLFDTDFTRESDKVAAGAGLPVPVDAPFGRIAVAICYDLRFPELARTAALAGADVLVYASAWVDGPRKVEQWRTLLGARAVENEIFVAGLSRCDRAFGSEKRDYAGNSCVFGPRGELMASAGAAEELLVADIDLGQIAEARASMPVLEHIRHDLY